MKIYKHTLVFDFKPKENFKQKAINYFSEYGFIYTDKGDSHLFFYKKSNFFEGWKMNPLNWESEIELLLDQNTIQITYKIVGLYITPKAFKTLYISFITNFKEYLISNKSYFLENKIQIKQAKQKLGLYYVILLMILLFGIFLSRMFIGGFFGVFLFIGIAYYSESVLNNYLEKKFS